MTYIRSDLRRSVIQRAQNLCEYCLVDQDDSFFTYQIDHIISEKHGGKTLSENLCLSCPECNVYKGSDIGSIDPDTNRLTPFFNPRTQVWLVKDNSSDT